MERTGETPIGALKRQYDEWRRADREAEESMTPHNIQAVKDAWGNVIQAMEQAGVRSSDQLQEMFEPQKKST